MARTLYIIAVFLAVMACVLAAPAFDESKLHNSTEINFAMGCKTNSDCGEAQFLLFCNHDLKCDAPGKCGFRRVCHSQAGPVCGCDGQNYPSDCEAHHKGVSVKASGSC
eukprot:Colp12_sorted_trinity150504_noHs@33803